MRAHPRERGEHHAGPTHQGHPAGSSPRARGAPCWRLCPSLLHGLIPASAGSTALRGPSSRSIWAHPRERGEHRLVQLHPARLRGSSPRARGARDLAVPAGGLAGLIPASAGSTFCNALRSSAVRAHPRERGEHPALRLFPGRGTGSSPRARGALPAGALPGPVVGLIPASAGSTRPTSVRRPPNWAHPRERGEHPHIPRSPDTQWGSSPRARGARGSFILLCVIGGLIPASAGSTGSVRRIVSLRWGSSPRARGALIPRLERTGPDGLIPASAGSTGPGLPGAGVFWAHPRERGEHVLQRLTILSCQGSSPRARGAHLPGSD